MSIAGLIAGGIGFGIGPHYIPTRGLSFDTQDIILQPVAVDRYFGDLTLLSTGTSTQKYIVYINGVDRTRWIRVGANSGPGIVMNMSLSAAGTCTFTTNGWPHGTNPATIPVASQYIPASLESVQIRRVSDGLLMFNGSVDTLSIIRILGHAQAVQSVVTCVDASDVDDILLGAGSSAE